MEKEKPVRKSIDIPRDPEFRKDLTRLAWLDGFHSSKEWIEQDLKVKVAEFRKTKINND